MFLFGEVIMIVDIGAQIQRLTRQPERDDSSANVGRVVCVTLYLARPW